MFHKWKNDPVLWIEKETCNITKLYKADHQIVSDITPLIFQVYEGDKDNRDAKQKHKQQFERGVGRQRALKTMKDKLFFILF